MKSEQNIYPDNTWITNVAPAAAAGDVAVVVEI